MFKNIIFDYIWNPSTCICENGKYLESTTDESIITCDEIIDTVRHESEKSIAINFNDKNGICKMDNLYILLAFVSIKLLKLIIIDIYCYYCHIKHRSKQKQMLPCYHSNKKLKQIDKTHVM